MATQTQAGWYDDGTGVTRWWSGQDWTDRVQAPAPQFILKEKLWGTGSVNLT